jgi:hypothetical protein
MKRVLLVGLDPDTVDFSDPSLPPGLDAQKIRTGINVALADMTAHGWVAHSCLVTPDDTAPSTLERYLAANSYDCVVIGAGIRLPKNRLNLFEVLLNTVHRNAAAAAIAFNIRPEDSADAAARWI